MTLIRSPFFSDFGASELLKQISELLEPKIDLEKASLIDTYRFTEGKLTYKQYVYRLPDRTIYVETKLIEDEELSSLKRKLDRAVKNQKFEDAAAIRDEIEALTEKQ